jgi:Ribbon-helix-helix protein, copG family
MKRITLNLHDEQADALRKRAAASGVLVSEQIRRAIAADLTPPQTEHSTRAAQPVLITPRPQESK